MHPAWLLGHLWAAPMTLLGCVLALVTGARLARRDSDGVLHFVSALRGPLAWFFRRFHVVAFTWGAAILYADALGPASPLLVRHERAHVRQTMWFGPLMPLAYGAAGLWQLVRGRHPYRDNWFEVHARAAE